MKIIADENMPGLEGLPAGVTLVRVPGRSLVADDVADADALLVRSVTRVDRALLAGSRVRFVGSATIGTDHLDVGWLQDAGIQVAHAPGCNAMAVAEYVLQVTLAWVLERGLSPEGLSVGLLGAGNVGARAGWLLQALGCRVLFSDPPREARGESAPVGQWASLEAVLSCPVVSLHVPLVEQGPWPTRHLLDRSRLAHMGPDQLLLNTCRGAVIDNQALLAVLEVGQGPEAVLDVWENEPAISAALCRQVRLGTPHVAGYTVEGKLRGSWMVLRALAEARGFEWTPPDLSAGGRHLTEPLDSLEALLGTLEQAFSPARDYQSLLVSLEVDDPALEFDRMRRNYAPRHELGGAVADRIGAGLEKVLRRLGVGWDKVPASSDPAARWLRESCSR